MMSPKDNGEPAFPVQDISKWQCPGMTVRDYFAAKAMQRVILVHSDWMLSEQVREAYIYADAMLAERAK